MNRTTKAIIIGFYIVMSTVFVIGFSAAMSK
jgi:hypothetical protein